MFHPLELGTGKVTHQNNLYTLTLPPSSHYSDAQINSYQTTRDFTFKSPVTMSLQARFEGELRGTAGFGFWNHPGLDGIRLPKAVWFFHASTPNNIALAKGIPGHGWKAATFDAANWKFLALLPAAPLGFLLMKIPFFYNRLWSIGQNAIGVSEKLLDESLLHDWHEYSLDWRADGITFRVDGQTVHQTPLSPTGTLGFAAWIDNQYAIVTPQGHFGYGIITTTQPQTLLIRDLKLSS